MRRILHILTTPDDGLAEATIKTHLERSDQEVKVVDLRTTEPDYHALLEDIFAADSVQVW